MDKLSLMETYVAIAEGGSLTAAAKSLGKSLPTVVRALALLEEHLGVLLIQRTTRSLSFTNEGVDYLDKCRQILADIHEAEADLTLAGGTPRGRIRLTAPVLFGQKKVAPVVNRFLKQYPEVQVELVLLDRVVDLIEEGFDVGVRIAPLADSSLIATRISTVHRVLVASPAFLKRHKRPCTPEDLLGAPAVLFSRDDPRADHFHFFRDGKPLTVPIEGALRSNHAQVSIHGVLDGLGFGQFLSYQVEDLIEKRRLIPLLNKYRPPDIPVHVIFAHRRLLSARTRALVDWLKAELAP